MSDTPRPVVGILRSPTGAPLINRTLTWYRSPRKALVQGASVIVDEVEVSQTDSAGSVAGISLVPGAYLIRVRITDADRYFEFRLPEGAGDYDIADGMDTAAPVITPPDVVLAREARDESRAYAQSPTPPDPADPTGKSSKTWAEIAQGHHEAIQQIVEGLRHYATLAALLEDDTLWDVGTRFTVTRLGEYLAVDASKTIGSLLTAGGVRLLPVTLNTGQSVFAAGAIGDGATNDTATLQIAFDTAVHRATEGVGLIVDHAVFLTDTLALRHDTSILGIGTPEFALRTANTALFTVAVAPESDVAISGVKMVGTGTNFTGATSERGVSFPPFSMYDFHMDTVRVDRFQVGVFDDADNAEIWLTYSLLKANSCAGLLSRRPQDLFVIGNVVDGDRTGVGDQIDTRVGIWTLPGSAADAGRESFIAFNAVRHTFNEGIIARGTYTTLVGNSASYAATGTGGSYAIIVEGSEGTTHNGAGDYCIAVANRAHHAEGGFAFRMDPANASTSPAKGLVVGNLAHDTTMRNGFELGFAGNPDLPLCDYAVIGNVADTTGAAGFAGGNTVSAFIAANVSRDALTSGIALFGPVTTDNTITNNLVDNPGRDGISVQGITNRSERNWIVGNFIKGWDSAASANFDGINCPTLTQEHIVESNILDGRGTGTYGVDVGGFGHFIGRNIVGGLRRNRVSRAVRIARSGDLWQPSTIYLLNERCQNGAHIYLCTQSGVTSATPGPNGKGAAIADGDAVWAFEREIADYYETERHLVLSQGYTTQPTGDSYMFRPVGSRHTSLKPAAGGFIGSVCTTEGVVWGSVWQPSAAYQVGDVVANGAHTYICTVAGTTSVSTGPSGTASSISDGSVTWAWFNRIAIFKPYGAIAA